MKRVFKDKRFAKEAVGHLILSYLTEDIKPKMTNKVMDNGKIEFSSSMNLPLDSKLTAYFYLDKTDDPNDIDWEASHFTLD